jgi:MSHA biogenesis protein MshK
MTTMNMPMRPTVACLLLLAALSASSQPAGDPTRPPAGFDAVAPVGAAAPARPAKASLQSIIRRADGRPAAIIDGELVALGGRVGDARLARVGEDSVDLATATGRETLQLTPGIGKRPVATESTAAKRPRHGKQRERRAREEATP